MSTEPHREQITFSLAMVREFLKTASEEAREIVRNMGCVEDPHGGPERENDAVLCWLSAGHSGAGLYVYCGEYPEDGSAFLSFQLDEALRLQRATLLEEWLCEECGSLNKGADEACRKEQGCSGQRPDLPGVRWQETDAGFKYPPPGCESSETCRECPLYRCSKCQKDRPWCFGANDELPDWCDECVDVHGYPGEEVAVPSVELGGDTEPLPMPSFDRVIVRQRTELVRVTDSDSPPTTGAVAAGDDPSLGQQAGTRHTAPTEPGGGGLSQCRRCSECIGAEHHWMDNHDCNGEEDPEYACKHCEATAFMCGECDAPVPRAEMLCASCDRDDPERADDNFDPLACPGCGGNCRTACR